GTRLDVEGARAVLNAISGTLGLQLDLGDLKEADELADFLTPFDFGTLRKKRKTKETKPDWFI
ncbi:MAG: hypothetical protein NWF14_07175, partial [Candidatus Bathyarchaeota archaeon]|nr:hypothetical protein [Candidatus Bathyarchaeota archaeon]